MANIRHLRAVGPPLGGYLRPGHRDGALLAKLITQGFDVGTGIVLDPALTDRTVELRDAARAAGIELVADPRSVELSMPGGFARSSISSLPWAGGSPHTYADLKHSGGDELCRSIAVHVVETGVSAVLAPTHFLDSVPDWLSLDSHLARKLRSELDSLGADQVAIYYPLVSTLRALSNGRSTERIAAGLSMLAREGVIDAVWLRLHPFGTSSAGPINLRRYILLAQDLAAIGLPLVGEKTGTVGLVLLAFNAVGAIESSITYGDRFDVRALQRPSDGKGFIPPPRVYLSNIGALVKKSTAEALLDKPILRGRHSCQSACCPRGYRDMLDDPRRHFVVSRSLEVARISKVPAGARPEHYLTTWLRPASDRAVQVAKADPDLIVHRERLDNWRVTLSTMLESAGSKASPGVLVPTGRRLRGVTQQAP